MAEHSSIAWTRSTFNAWIGCTKVGPGCDHCYAEQLDKRHRWGGAVHWGAGVPRFRTSAKNWSHPIEWNKLAGQEQERGVLTMGSEWKGKVGFWPVFCASLADVFDNEVPDRWRWDLLNLIERTPNLEWLLVTKRISNVARMLAPLHVDGPVFFPNVRLLITVCNQEEADRDIPKLLALPCKNGISYEPALGPVEFYGWMGNPEELGRNIEWIIVGGESTQGSGKARPFVHGWARETIKQCRAAGVPVFVKQMGSNATNREGVIHPYKDRAGADPAEWPEDLRVQEFPA